MTTGDDTAMRFDDDATGAVDAALRQLAVTTQPPPAFLDAVGQQVRAEAARAFAGAATADYEEAVGPLAMVSPTLGAVPRRRARPWQALLALATAALLLLSIGGGAAWWWLLRPQSVSAATVLARAEQTATSGSPGLRSYISVTSTHLVTGQGYTNDVEYRMWYEAPDHQRFESYVKNSAHPDEINVLNITNGGTRWEVVPASRQATRKTPLPVTGGYAGATDVRSLLKNVGDRNADVKLVGTEKFVGRDAYVLQMTLAANPNASYPDGSTMKLYIDKDTFIGLGSETRDAGGTMIAWSRFTQLQVNVSIPADRFTYVPPAGVSVVDATGQAVLDAPTYARQLREAAGTARFAPLVPGSVPAGLVPLAPLADPDLVALGYASADDPEAGDAFNGPPLTVTERRSLPEDATMPQGAEVVAVAGASGAWYVPPRVSGPYTGSSRLVVLRDGVTVTLGNAGLTVRPAQMGSTPSVTGVVLTKEQLVAVATSLTPVGRP